MPGLPPIEWRVHLSSSPSEAFEAWTTDAGRELFWAERSEATQDGFRLTFIGGEVLDVRVTEAVPPRRFTFHYFAGSRVSVDIEPATAGCDVHLREEGASESDHLENYAGWVSALLALKAAIDFDIDLRGHDPSRSWTRRYVDN